VEQSLEFIGQKQVKSPLFIIFYSFFQSSFTKISRKITINDEKSNSAVKQL